MPDGNVEECSAGGDPSHITIAAYLETTNEDAAESVFGAVSEVVALMGYGSESSVSVERGSFFRRSKAAVRKALTSEQLNERLCLIEQAIKVSVLDGKQAEVNNKESEAIARLLSAINEIPQACIRTSSLLILKYQEGATPVVLVRTLSPHEIGVLERYPEIQRSPANALEQISLVIESSPDTDPPAPK